MNELDQVIGWSYSSTGEPARMTLWTIAQADPRTKDDCKKGGWTQYGFKNQGRCEQSVLTGKDSRQARVDRLTISGAGASAPAPCPGMVGTGDGG